MFALKSYSSDDCTYSSYEAICIFDSKEVAELVAYELNRKMKKGEEQFSVSEIAVYHEDSEGSIKSLVAKIKEENKQYFW